MTGDLRTLRRLRDEARVRDDELRDVRLRRDRLAVWLRGRGWSARDVGSAAGLAPSYVEDLVRRARPSDARVRQSVDRVLRPRP